MEKIQCPYCDKKIKGETKNQADSLLSIHKIMKHKDRVEIREIK